jgi:hypothetical protein
MLLSLEPYGGDIRECRLYHNELLRNRVNRKTKSNHILGVVDMTLLIGDMQAADMA